ncbi:MAG: helix-turn-helix transcriptional regulator [Actinomycetia bacterium]|jgi:DNA-binding NarL/FixJ family response regulator|nr:helix-turn-helix transcriptional regulator [Actinomycetes bacterium]
MSEIALSIHARDPISEAGIAAELRGAPGLRLVERDSGDDAVALVVTDEVDEEAVRILRTAQMRGCGSVIVVSRIDERGLLAAVEAGAGGFVRRSDATASALLHCVRGVAAGEGTVPSDLLGRLLAQIGRLQRQVLTPRGISVAGLNDREVDVLRLVADGFDTGEIATKLSYSERTIKNVIHAITTRLGVRNRSQAVAFALREGLI